jgi:hypothetical protein
MSKVKVGHAPIAGTLIVQVITFCVAILIIQFMHKLDSIPECKKIEPYTREGLLAYSYFLAFISGLSCVVMLIFLLSK